MPIRLLHFADLHLGMENHGHPDPVTGLSSRLRDFVDRLDEVVDYALTHAADLVIFAGDAFKTRDPDPTQQREFAQRLKRLAERVPVFMLVGNHDLPGMAAKATSIDIFSILDVPNITVGRKPDGAVFQTRHGPVYLGWVPFPVRTRLLTRDQHQGASVEELDRAVADTVSGSLARLAAEAATHAMPRVLVGHFTLHGADFGSERQAMMGRDLAIQKSDLADPAWDYVALGHIHKHQNLTARDPGAPPVVYSGSLERVDFGEAGQPKGFCWVHLERGATTWEFVPVAARPFIKIEVDARGAADPTAAVIEAIGAHNVQGAVVWVVARLLEEQEAGLRRREVERALVGAEKIAAITLEVERAARLAQTGGSAESLTPPQWLTRYFEARQRPPERIEQLLQTAASLWSAE